MFHDITDSNSIDKSLNLSPSIRPDAKHHPLPPSIDTTSNVSLQTLPSSSNVIDNTNPTKNQIFPTSTSQTTKTTANLSTSHIPNQITPPSNTLPVIPYNIVQLPVYQIPTIHPTPLSLDNTISTQPLTQNPPTYFHQNPSLINQNPPSSLGIPPNPSNSQPSTSNLQSTSYIPYVSLHPGFQTFPTNSFQLPIIPPNPLPPSNSILPFNPPSSYPSPHFQMPPFVQFAALSDPIKLFDGLDHTSPPEKFLAHVSARVTFQLSPQPIDLLS